MYQYPALNDKWLLLWIERKAYAYPAYLMPEHSMSAHNVIQLDAMRLNTYK